MSVKDLIGLTIEYTRYKGSTYTNALVIDAEVLSLTKDSAGEIRFIVIHCIKSDGSLVTLDLNHTHDIRVGQKDIDKLAQILALPRPKEEEVSRAELMDMD